MMMWWILLCAAVLAVHGQPDEDERLGFEEVLASGDWPGLGWPNPNPVPVDGLGCVQPGDMYNALLGSECYVCACFLNERGYLKAKCAPCSSCWNHDKPSPVPLPPAPQPKPIPNIPIPEPIPIPGSIPVSEPIPIPGPIPVPEPMQPILSPFCPPPTIIPGPPRPYPVPVPVPGKKVYVPVPVPSPPEKVYVPGPPVQVPVEVIKRVPVPYPVDKLYPVPTTPAEVPVPYPMNRYVPVVKNRVVVVPIIHHKYHSVTKIIYIAEHCRYQEPLVPFHLPSDPCRIHICKIQYNYVYDEIQPGSSCRSFHSETQVVPHGYNIGGGSAYAKSDTYASATSSGASADAGTSANSGSGYYGWGGSEAQAQADASASFDGWGEDVSAHADSQANAGRYFLGGWGQSSLAKGLARTGLEGYDFSGWGKGQASASGQGLGGYGVLGRWGVDRADEFANAGLERYGGLGSWMNNQALADELVKSGGWELNTPQAEDAALEDYGQADANAGSGKSDHHVQRRSVSFDYEELERSGLAPLISPSPNPVLIRGLWNKLPIWKNNNAWAQAVAQAEANVGLGGYSQAETSATAQAGSRGWQNSVLPERFYGLRLPYSNGNSDSSAHADAQGIAGSEGYSNAQADALSHTGVGGDPKKILNIPRYLGSSPPGKYNGLGLKHLPNPIRHSEATAYAEAIGRADQLDSEDKRLDDESREASEKCGCGSHEKCGNCGLSLQNS